MPNFKFIKRASFFFVLAFVLFSHNVSLAQERISARDSELAVLIESAEIKTTELGMEIEAILFNPSSTAETPLATYLLTLSNIDPLVASKGLDYTPAPLIVSANEGEDYFSLKPGERKTVRYFLPVSRYLPIANYALNFRLMQRSGDIVGQYREILRDFGFNAQKASQENYEKGFLAFFQESCVILNAKGEKFEPNEGPVFNPSEQPKARCLVKNIGDEDVSVRSKIIWKEFFVYGRPSSGARAEETSDIILTFKKGETKLVEVLLPQAEKPQVYQALWSFEDESSSVADKFNGKRSFDMSFRWTIGGASARAEKISLLSPIKNVYEKGETVSLSVDYFGSMDLYWNNSSDESVGLSKIRILAIVKDNNNEICGENDFNLRDISDSERKNQIIDIVLDKKCEGASYTVSIHSGEEKLAEETAEIPKTAETKTMKNYYYAGAAIIFLAFFIAIRKSKRAIVPVLSLLLVFAAFGIFFNSADASATKTYAGISYGGEDYGGDATDNSAPLYSFYGVNDTSNVNKLVIKKVETNIDSDLNGFYADIYYAAGFTSCSNSTMHIRFKMYIEANGLAKTQVKFAPAGSTNYQSKQIREYASVIYAADEELFDIDPASLRNFYDDNEKFKANSYLIIEIAQSGKSTHSNPYHRGDFSKPVSAVDYATRADAFDASDTIIYRIPLNLPAPSADLSLSGTSPIDYDCKPTLSWTVNDVDSCDANGAGWSGTLDKSNGTHNKTMLTGITASTDYGLSCSKNLGSAIGKGTYTDSVTVEVKDAPTVDLKAKKWGNSTSPTADSFSNSLTINSGDSVTFHWGLNNWSYSSAGVQSCEFEGVNYTSGTQKTISNITNAKTYNITCKNSCGYSVADSVAITCNDCIPKPTSSSSSSADAPSQPQNFTASPACQKVNLSWNKDNNGEYSSTNSGSKVVNYYEITRGGSYTIEKSDNINRSGWSSNSYTDNGATDTEKEYSYTIKACNDQKKCSANAGPATASPTAGPCAGTPTTPITPVTTPPTSSTSADPDWYNLTFKTSGSGSGNATRYAYDDTWGWTGSKTMNNGDTAGIGRDYKFKLVPNPSSGSYFSSWSGCVSVNSDNECLLEKNPYPGADKTVTATFNDSAGSCPNCGSNSVKAYISARDTVVTDGNSTVITWTSDNATSCEQVEDSGLGSGSYKDTGWISANDTASGNYTTANFTTSGGSRTYKVTCTDGSQSADAEVTVSVGSDYTGSPSVNMWADPQSVGYKKTSAIQWLGSNVQGSCLLYSASDDMNGYLKDYGRAVVPSFGTGYYASVGSNNTTGQTTGKLASDTTYKIQCKGYGPSYAKVTAQTTVAAAKPVSNFTIANSSGASLVATIVEGLSANSNNIALALSGEAIGNVSLSASIPAISGAKAQFSSDNEKTWSDILSVDISAISEVKIRAIKIPGATTAGIYNTAITATDTGTGGKTKKLNIDLRVDRVSSEWEEF